MTVQKLPATKLQVLVGWAWSLHTENRTLAWRQSTAEDVLAYWYKLLLQHLRVASCMVLQDLLQDGRVRKLWHT
jgi:hypothetical protein